MPAIILRDVYVATHNAANNAPSGSVSIVPGVSVMLEYSVAKFQVPLQLWQSLKVDSTDSSHLLVL